VAPIFVYFSEATKDKNFKGVTFAILGLIIVAMLLRGQTSRKAILLSLLAWPLANGFTEALKTAIPMLRPCVELPDVHLAVGRLDSFGTASSHAANTAAVAFVMVYIMRSWGIPWVIVAFLTGLSRIYVGVHYPSQVVLGWFCGALCGLIVVKTWEGFATRRARGAYPLPEAHVRSEEI
jgi:undecaprenyl-diphosphatase